MTTQLLTDLQATRALIARPEQWTTGRYARNSDGLEVAFNADEATCFCLEGAVMRVAGGDSSANDRYRHIVRAIEAVRPTYIAFNDTHTHAEVLELLDRIISAEARNQ